MLGMEETNMTTYKVKAYTSPVGVREQAETVRRVLGVANIVEGTEHIYWDAEGQTPAGAAWNAQVDLESAGVRYLRVIPVNPFR
jgi:hypothetical protein